MRATVGDDVVTVIDAQGLIEPVPTVVAVEALEQLLRGREVTATRHLATVTDRAGREEMCALLVEIAAGALDALRDRARYRVRTDVVLSWLGPLEGATHDACLRVLQRAVFHSAGLESPPSTPPTDHELTTDLAAALLVARGVVELVARRRWLRPTAMLDDVVSQSLRRWIEPHEAPLDPDADRLET